MPITILNPQPVAPAPRRPRAVDIDMDVPSDSESDSENGGAVVEDDIPMHDDESVHVAEDDEEYEDYEQDDTRDEILTPGTVITSNSQWMRYCYPYSLTLCYSSFPFFCSFFTI
jgi:exosome complex component RRP4